MNEQVFHESTPQGSAILAFGKVAGPNRSGAFLLAAAGIIFLILMGFLLRTLFSPTIPLPKETVLVGFISKQIVLPSTAPELWRNSQESALGPILAGWSLDETGARVPFTITLRGTNAQQTQTAWIWGLNSPHRLEVALQAPTELASWSDYFHGLWLKVWPSKLWPEVAAGFGDSSIGGAIRDSKWTTDLKAPTNVVAPEQFFGSNFINISVLPAVWAILQPTFNYYDIYLDLTTPPKAAFWALKDTGDLSLALVFNELTLIDKAEIAASVGLFDQVSYSLPDGTIVSENRSAFNALTSSSKSVWRADKEITFSTNTVILGEPSMLNASHLNDVCRGNYFAVLDRQSVSSLLKNLEIDFITFPERLYLIEENGRTSFCWSTY